MSKQLTTALGVLVLALAIAACGDDSDDGDSGSAAGTETLSGSFEVLPDAPEGSDGVSGEAELTVGEDGTEASIELTGLEPEAEYASHVHAGACGQPDPGGPHFKFDLDGPEMPPNEIHLPFTADADGNGSATASNEEPVPDPGTRSIVVHLAGEVSHEEAHGDDGHGGMDDSGMAGEKDDAGDGGKEDHTHSDPKIACVDLG